MRLNDPTALPDVICEHEDCTGSRQMQIRTASTEFSWLLWI